DYYCAAWDDGLFGVLF
nr:immunoglobulin light chain junction region [Macaca mulatta]MOW56959.1 immunoglobulin light chain junction region [Macaca mulatta]MOW57240.1 immunoglobulin light chain junction region [Macaca mulatta]MOW57875.1 immunoglobulin light chain junction region [Macaca mulatta]MOW59796.1 immunoglobulin light chain junction region [Macaca mulatta]